MRRLLLASLMTLAPALALAQSAPPSDNGTPPPPGADDFGPCPGFGGGPGGPGGKDHRGGLGPERLMLDFYSANTSHDGHLTLAQAKAANFHPIVEHFADIDVKKHGYVTFYDIEAWRLDDMAQKLEQRATALRAQD